jgi:hypothetical protein
MVEAAFRRSAAGEPPMTKQVTSKKAVDMKTATAAQHSSLPRVTKIGKVIALLERKDGATLDELVEATGWLPHTTRAGLTGLKKKGHTIERDKRGDTTCYRITKSA